MNFSILNSQVTVIDLRFIKNTYFHAVSRKIKLKITVLAFLKQENLKETDICQKVLHFKIF